MKRLIPAALALGLLIASCGNEEPAANTATVPVDTAMAPVVTPPPTTHDTMTAPAGATSAVSANAGTAIPPDPAAPAAGPEHGAAAANGAKTAPAHKEEAHMQDGTVKTKTVTKTDENGNTKTKTKTVTSH